MNSGITCSGTVAAALVLALCLLLPIPTRATPFSPDDVFLPICNGTLLPDPPPGGWLPWSDPATWQGGPIPGTGAQVNANVTIPCGVGVLLDLPLVQLTLLNVSGALKFKDDPSLPLVNLTAAFVVVGGRFIVGEKDKQYRQKAEVRLKPNPAGRANLAFSYPAPADPFNRRSVGHKAFAVVGGQVDLHGLPGSASTPSWVKLAATAQVGDVSVTVRGDVSAWPVGAPIVISPTDYYFDRDDVRTIRAVICTALGICQIMLDRGLNYSHFGDPLGVPDGFGGYIDETAEVALLSRNIVITGTDEPAPYSLEGGHFIIFLTGTPQVIEGVEFLMMGQQGNLGRYNIHFHVCGDTGGRSVVRRNLVLHSKQRCVVVHATDNTVIEENVAYNTSGHCFMIEEGGETGNTFRRNLGMRTRAVTVPIPLTPGSNVTEETDMTPATFWITNPNNSYIDNVAAGSEDSGFWMELRTRVRGVSLTWPKLNWMIPNSFTPIGRMSGNSAHSNRLGFQGYKHGYHPKVNATVTKPGGPPVWVEITGFSFWMNREKGIFLHGMDHVAVTNCSFADNPYGAHMNRLSGVNVSNSRFVGQSRNYGTPSKCQSAAGRTTCGPVTGCTFPLPAGAQGRSVTSRGMNRTIFGVVFDENRSGDSGTRINFAANNTFSGYASTPCRVAAAVGVGGNTENFWSAGFGFANLTFDTSVPTNPIYLLPASLKEAGGATINSGDVATLFAIRDYDGSIVGSNGGYVVANNSALLPPASFTPACSPLPAANAYACPGTCYRSVFLVYQEDNIGLNLTGSSALLVTRLQDGASQQIRGNQAVNPKDDEDEADNVTSRYFPLVLLAGYTYEITFVPSANFPNFYPENISITYRDGPGCGQGVTLRFKGASSPGPFSWTLDQSDVVTSWAACPGNTGVLTGSAAPLQFSYACTSSLVQALELTLTASFPSGTAITLYSNTEAPAPCSNSVQCGLVGTFSSWAYNQGGQNLQPAYPGGPAFYNPLYPPATSSPDWQMGSGVLGSQPRARTLLLDPNSKNRTTYYFRTMFTVASSACYSSLMFDIQLKDGVALYLNNVEVLRANLPQGPLSNSTKAFNVTLAYEGSNVRFTTFTVPLAGTSLAALLVEGTNYLAAEVHSTGEVSFALKATGMLNIACSGRTSSAEVCDGLDNDNDGQVDVDPSTNELLERPCSSKCGIGAETCINGAYQGCTAASVSPETCNGIDDDCDGLVDNGLGQLDCPSDKVCFAGKCRPPTALTAPQTVWGPQAPGWYYSDKGYSMDAFPSWKTGVLPTAGNWSTGSGAFGVYPSNANLTFATPLGPNTKNNITARYFTKGFSLAADDVALTYGFFVTVRAVDGAVVYLNGAELFRTNMPAGNTQFASLALQSAARTSTADPNALSYYPSLLLRASGSAAATGQNWIAAELHPSAKSTKNWVFDMALTRYVVQTCPNGYDDSSCVRYPPVDTVIIPLKSNWSFLDASAPLPADTWNLPSADVSSWISGPAPFGQSSGTNLTYGDRLAAYFRKAVTVPDGRCFYNLTLSVVAVDGAVVYINGAEALRFNMPAGNLTAASSASAWGSTASRTFLLSNGWLKNGGNVIAVEVHQFARKNNTRFDLSMTGRREGGTCSPLPP